LRSRDDLVTAALALLILLPGISAPFWNRDEADYAAVARTMARGGSLAAPVLFGRPFVEKPPLVFWVTAASFRLFGESEAAGRLPHVLLAALAVVLVRRLGVRTGARDRGRSAAIVFATSLLWIVYGRLLLTEAGLVLFDLAAIHGLLSLETPRFRPAVLAGTATALALAMLAKGPVALAAPALFTAGSLGRGRPRFAPIARLAAAAGIAALLVAPWWLGRESGGGAFFARENLGRFLRPRESHAGPLLYYAPVLLAGLFPWAGFAAGRRRLLPGQRRWLPWAWGIPALFSLSATKLPHYVVPALPAFAMISSDRFRESGERGRRAAGRIAAATGLLLLAGGLGAAARVEFPALLLPSLAALGITAGIALLLPGLASSRRAFFAAAMLAAISVPLLLPGALERGRALAFLGRAASDLRRAGEPAGGWKFDEVALDFYSGVGERRKWNDAAELRGAIVASPVKSILLWIPGRDAPSLARRRGIALAILAARSNVVETGPTGEILLCRARLPVRDGAFARDRRFDRTAAGVIGSVESAAARAQSGPKGGRLWN
jgi:4-amino-4-deoxy-L-arabinose transferase-like glycosyltransferase